MAYTCPCPACTGTGIATDFMCCGQSDGDECCGNSILMEMSCHPCQGSGSMNDEVFLAYAILSRDMALLAQHESMLILSSMPELDIFKKKEVGRL